MSRNGTLALPCHPVLAEGCFFHDRHRTLFTFKGPDGLFHCFGDVCYASRFHTLEEVLGWGYVLEDLPTCAAVTTAKRNTGFDITSRMFSEKNPNPGKRTVVLGLSEYRWNKNSVGGLIIRVLYKKDNLWNSLSIRPDCQGYRVRRFRFKYPRRLEKWLKKTHLVYYTRLNQEGEGS